MIKWLDRTFFTTANEFQAVFSYQFASLSKTNGMYNKHNTTCVVASVCPVGWRFIASAATSVISLFGLDSTFLSLSSWQVHTKTCITPLIYLAVSECQIYPNRKADFEVLTLHHWYRCEVFNIKIKVNTLSGGLFVRNYIWRPCHIYRFFFFVVLLE